MGGRQEVGSGKEVQKISKCRMKGGRLEGGWVRGASGENDRVEKISVRDEKC